MNLSDEQNPDGNKIKKQAHQIALASILEVASKTTIVFGKTLVILVFDTLRYVASNGSFAAILDSIENQFGNFTNGL